MEIVNEFNKNFLLGGLSIGIFTVLIKYYSTKLAGYLSGALPLILTYVIIYTYITKGRKQTKKLIYFSLIGVIFWIIYALAILIMLYFGFNFILTISTAIIIFVLMHYLFYDYLI
jgi:uncharacterized membrane protein (GlpM family)